MAASTKRGTKEHKTISLSRQAARFLDIYRKESGVNSTSAAVERLIAEKNRERGRRQIDDQISAYYDALSGEQQLEERQWGEFAEGEMSTE